MLPKNYGRESGVIIGWIQSNLKYFLRVVTWQLKDDPASVSEADFNRLVLLFRHSNNSSLGADNKLSEACTPIKSAKNMSYNEFKSWLEKSLGWDTSFYPIPQGGPPNVGGDASVRSNASMMSGHSLPHGHSLGMMGHSLNRIKRSPNALVIHGVTRQTIFKEVPADGNIHISSCSDCTIYITSECQWLHIGGCENCTIVAVCVRKMASLWCCDKLRFHSVRF